MESKKIDIFEHLVNPIDDLKLETALRIWQAIPFFSECLTNRIVDLLQEKGYWRQVLKRDFNMAFKHFSPESKRLITQCCQLDNPEYHPLNYETSLCEKFVDSFLSYYQKIIEMASISSAKDSEEKDKLYKKYMVDRAQFLITLNKGDVFTFIDNGRYEEFTYDGHRTIRNSEVICDYISKNCDGGPRLYHCENIYRPVIKQTIE